MCQLDKRQTMTPCGEHIICCSQRKVSGQGEIIEAPVSDESLATKSVQMNKSLTQTNQTDSSLLFDSFILRLDSSRPTSLCLAVRSLTVRGGEGRGLVSERTIIRSIVHSDSISEMINASSLCTFCVMPD